MSLFKSIAKVACKVGKSLKKAAPEIAVIGGTVGLVTTTVIAVKQTPKAMAIKEEHKEKMEIVDECLEKGMTENEEPYTEEDAKHDRVLIRTQDAVAMAKVYAIPAAIAILSVAAIFGGAKIFRKRITALTGAYAMLQSSFDKYRGNVIEKFGKDIDQELRYGLKKELSEETVVNENGKEHKEVTEKTTTTYDGHSQYARFFDETSSRWEKDGGRNLSFLSIQQKYANDKLRSEGVLFLNDVYDALGFSRTPEGQLVGWIWDPSNNNADNYVDFGITEVFRNKELFKEFMKDHERSLLLDFNCDGRILEKFTKYDRRN